MATSFFSSRRKSFEKRTVISVQSTILAAILLFPFDKAAELVLTGWISLLVLHFVGITMSFSNSKYFMSTQQTMFRKKATSFSTLNTVGLCAFVLAVSLPQEIAPAEYQTIMTTFLACICSFFGLLSVLVQRELRLNNEKQF